MENKFEISDKNKKVSIAVKFESGLNQDDLQKIYKIISISLDLFDSKDVFLERLEKEISMQN